jgi:hypothetical protein
MNAVEFSKPILLSSSMAPEKIKGDPKAVRVERRELHGPAQGRVHLQSVTEYRPGGLATEALLYRPDGSVSYRYVYEYAENGDLSKVTTLDDTGAIVQTRYPKLTKKGIEEEVLTDANGVEVERTIVKRDEEGRTLESTIMSPSGADIHLVFYNDPQGRPVEAQLSFKGEVEFAVRFGIRYESDQHTIITWYAPDGTVLMENKTMDGEFVQVLGANKTTERISGRDAVGNWTQKTIFESAKEPTAVIDRMITYY